jgi:hypothetical protein
MGKSDQASAYLKAAWTLTQDGVIGDHLGQVYHKQGKIHDAEHIYILALAASTPGADQDEIRRHYKMMTGKPIPEPYATHRLPDGTWTATPAEELSRMRTTKVANRSPAKGSATFSLVLSPGKVEKVEYLNGAEELKPVAEKVKTAKLDNPFPESAATLKLVRRGIVTCGSTGCDLTLLLPDSTNVNLMPRF